MLETHTCADLRRVGWTASMIGCLPTPDARQLINSRYRHYAPAWLCSTVVATEATQAFRTTQKRKRNPYTSLPEIAAQQEQERARRELARQKEILERIERDANKAEASRILSRVRQECSAYGAVLQQGGRWFSTGHHMKLYPLGVCLSHSNTAEKLLMCEHCPVSHPDWSSLTTTALACGHWYVILDWLQDHEIGNDAFRSAVVAISTYCLTELARR